MTTTDKNILKPIKFLLWRETSEIRVDVNMVGDCLLWDCLLSLFCIPLIGIVLPAKYIIQYSAQNRYSHNELTLDMFVLKCFWIFIVKEVCDILSSQCINLFSHSIVKVSHLYYLRENSVVYLCVFFWNNSWMLWTLL